ncbi:hypothetical protein PQO03_00255 [Lentisphaera profundi]|uniref:HEAT repeat domain-containing protein n=1 Tax=Lentisphaera profundi TaxID=1658616 RepID=A0ABY7VT02_9BACT|nr:hypothetical protein [Lentisphaera profundi]WDE96398.1 hypothetical protein PQO03_00255 [Lentisphaera profundi]
MGNIEQLINDLGNFKLRFKARRALGGFAQEDVCPALLNYLKQSDNNINGAWAALQVLKKFRYADVLGDLPSLAEAYPSLIWDIRDLEEIITGKKASDALAALETNLNPFAELRTLLGIDLLSFSDKGGFYSFVLKTDLTRKHEMILIEEENFYHIYTECGVADEEISGQLAALNENLDLGELKIESKEDGESALSLHYSITRESSAIEQEKVLRRLAQVADGLEKQLSDKDLI